MRYVLAFLLLASPALAEPVCGPRQSIIDELGKKYGEYVVWRGLVNAKIPQVVELLANEDGTTWTLVMTDVTGRACAPVNGFGGEWFKWVNPGNPT